MISNDAILAPHQIRKAMDAATIVRGHGVCLIAMETRTGKTRTAIQVANIIGAKKVLFVTKKAAIPSIEKDAKLFRGNPVVRVVNYEHLASKFCRISSFDMLILDESHRIGAYPKPCLAAQMIRQLPKVPTLLLSATPCPESWSQIFHQVWATKHELFGPGNFYSWVRAGYVTPHERRIGMNTIVDYSDANYHAVAKHIDPVKITCTQAEAGIQFTVRERTIRVPVSPFVRSLFNQLVKDRYIEFSDGYASGDTAAKLLAKCHQLISGTCITDAGKYVVLDRSKAIAIRQDAAANGYRKIVIFHKYKSERSVIDEVFRGIITDKWTQFQSDPSVRVFVSQIISGREGIRLDKADAIYIYNIDYAWLSYAQARERATSQDRLSEVDWVWVMASNIDDEVGLEDKIHKHLKSKEKYTAAFFRRDFL